MQMRYPEICHPYQARQRDQDGWERRAPKRSTCELPELRALKMRLLAKHGFFQTSQITANQFMGRLRIKVEKRPDELFIK